jgi:secreted PhoX family phosphatase
MLDRPEDIEIDPLTGHVLVSLTNNFPKGNYHGSILKIREKENDHFSLEFEHETFLAGGEETGFTCPDNMAFDPKGNLWLTSDIPGSLIGSNKFGSFGNNGLYYVPSKGSDAGKVIQMASAPVDAELTGPTFTPDGKTLFLSIQHPGERTTDVNDCTSNWPDGGKAIPKPSVVAIQGPLLERIVNNG